MTQNFVSQRELPAVLRFMKYRPEQVSGFKLRSSAGEKEKEQAEACGLDECDESYAGVYEAFVEALKRDKAEVAEEALKQVGEGVGQQAEEKEEAVKVEEKKEGMWTKVKEVEAGDEGGAFSFGFLEGVEMEDEDELL